MNQRIYYSQEAEQRANREKTIAIVLFLALGVGIGALLALLFAPRSGGQIRQEIASTFEEGFDTGRDATTTAVQRLEKSFAELSKKLEDRLK
jgi:gas vesicle protein